MKASISLVNLTAASLFFECIASVECSVDWAVAEVVLDPKYSKRCVSSISDAIGAPWHISKKSSPANTVFDFDATLRPALAILLRLLAHVVASPLLLLLSLLVLLFDKVLECSDSSVGDESVSSELSFDPIHLPTPDEDGDDVGNDSVDPSQESGDVPSVFADLLLSST